MQSHLKAYSRLDAALQIDNSYQKIFSMEKYYQCQIDRVDRLMEIITSKDENQHLGDVLRFEDVIFMAYQGMWHIKDWILNDSQFSTYKNTLNQRIHQSNVLRVCADLANGSKHLALHQPKIGTSGAVFSEARGIHVEKGIYRRFFYVDCSDVNNEYHGSEIRDLLVSARREWELILSEQYQRELRDGEFAY